MNRLMSRCRTGGWAAVVLAAAMSSLPGVAAAQESSSKVIRVVVPFSAAGVTDTVARVVFEQMSQSTGQRAVIENRVGAGGTLGMDNVAKSAPDGLTLVVGDPGGTAAANVTLYPKIAFNPETDLAPVALLGITAAVLVVPSGRPVTTFGEFVAYTKKHKGELLFGSVGAGTPGHLNVELLKSRAGIDGTHVPYRTISQGITDLITDRLAYWIPPIPTALAHIRSGKLRPLAVSGNERSSDLPDVPTFKELGVQDYDVSSTYAVFAPAATPRPVIERLQDELKKALSTESVRTRLRTAGVEPKFAPPDEVKALLQRSVKQWAIVIRSAGIMIDK
jgi:tripartite-type tricarboxylate transporter receptor subunit TctC